MYKIYLDMLSISFVQLPLSFCSIVLFLCNLFCMKGEIKNICIYKICVLCIRQSTLGFLFCSCLVLSCLGKCALSTQRDTTYFKYRITAAMPEYYFFHLFPNVSLPLSLFGFRFRFLFLLHTTALTFSMLLPFI